MGKGSKLTRITLGGVKQLPHFSGDDDDYFFIKRVTFQGQKDRHRIKMMNLRDDDIFYNIPEEYNPRDAQDFLLALNGVLKNEGWYLTYCNLKCTAWSGYQKLNGALIIPKEKKAVPKTKKKSDSEK